MKRAAGVTGSICDHFDNILSSTHHNCVFSLPNIPQMNPGTARTIADGLPGMTVAEIGSGWGGLAVHLARETGAHITGINVSPAQIEVARAHAEAAGVSDRVEFRELDYRQVTGQFDRVVSVGMMEHVGIGHFDEYFLKIRELLKPDGYAYPLHRPDVTARHHRPVHPQIHLSRRVCARAVGDFCRH